MQASIAVERLTAWLEEIRRRWPKTLIITQTDFGLTWRKYFQADSPLDYCFVQRSTGIGGSDENLEIRWFMNRQFRLALLRDWKTSGRELVIDFTRYDLKAEEPPDARPDQPSRNWSLMNRINQKGTRPQDKPVPLAKLLPADHDLIRRVAGTLRVPKQERKTTQFLIVLPPLLLTLANIVSAILDHSICLQGNILNISCGHF